MTSLLHLDPQTVHPPIGYSHAVSVTGEILVVSGQIGLAKDRSIIGIGDFEAQCVQAFENLMAVLQAGGAGPADVIRLGVILTDRQNLLAYRAIRDRYFTPPLPASTLIIAGLAMVDLLVEVEAMAVVPTT